MIQKAKDEYEKAIQLLSLQKIDIQLISPIVITSNNSVVCVYITSLSLDSKHGLHQNLLSLKQWARAIYISAKLHAQSHTDCTVV